jgi:hypothetical protein
VSLSEKQNTSVCLILIDQYKIHVGGHGLWRSGMIGVELPREEPQGMAKIVLFKT